MSLKSFIALLGISYGGTVSCLQKFGILVFVGRSLGNLAEFCRG